MFITALNNLTNAFRGTFLAVSSRLIITSPYLLVLFTFFMVGIKLVLPIAQTQAQVGICVTAVSFINSVTSNTTSITVNYGGRADQEWRIMRNGNVIATQGPWQGSSRTHTDSAVTCDGTNHDYSVEASMICGTSARSESISQSCQRLIPPTVNCQLDHNFFDWAGTSAMDSVGRNWPGFAGPFPDNGEGDSDGRAGIWWGRNGSIITGRWLNFDPFNEASTFDAYTDIPPGTYDVVCSVCATNNWSGFGSATACCIGDTSYKPGGVSYPRCASSGGKKTITVPGYDISGTVFIDTNYNGSRDSGEAGYNGIQVRRSGTSSGNVNTNSSGLYTFANLQVGSYSITLTPPSNYRATTSLPRSVNLSAADVANINIGIAPEYSISGTVFVDTNRNGTKDSGESNYGSSIQVRVTGAQSGSANTSSGSYTISGLRTGSYSVTITAPSNYRLTGSIPRSVSISNANVTNIHLGIAPVYSISGTVFLDTNRNGVRDSGESNFTSSVPVDINPGGSTNTSGSFTFTALDPGNYSISVTAPSNFRTTNSPQSRSVTNANITGVNLGIAPTYSISGVVFLDSNRNGVRDSGEGNFGSSVSIDINPGGSTNSSGSYTFSNLEPGTYSLSVTAPANFRTTNSPQSRTVTNANIANVNLGITPTYDISGTVFLDTNRNGVRDSGEGNFGQSVTVNLSGTASRSTSSSGSYSFNDLEPGNYSISLSNLPANYRTTNSPQSRSVTNANVTGVDLGITPTFSISGIVFLDTNRNGVRDGGEGNFGQSVTVNLSGTASRSTSSSGSYSFATLEPGNYSVSISNLPANFRATNSPQSRTITNANIANVDLGITPTFSISGIVFLDSNRNGVRDSGEGNFGTNVTVNLSGTASRSVSTSGSYSFATLEPGNYSVSISNLPTNFRTTNSPQARTITNANIANVDLGITPTYIISGTVFLDTNRNGVRDSGEGNFGSNVTVSLSGDASRTMSTSGAYSFSALEPGDYSLSVAAPANFRTTNSPQSVTVTNANVGSIHLGLAPVYSITGTVFIDFDRDGTKDSGEPNYTNALTVRMTGDASGTDATSGGNYAFADLDPGNYSLAITAPANYRTTNTPTSVTINNTNVVVHLGIAPVYIISGQIIIDLNRNGIREGGEALYTGGLTIRLSGDASATATTSNGTYSFRDLDPGDYTVTLSTPGDYGDTTDNPQSVTITNVNVTLNFGIAPIYTVAGNVFNDVNKNRRYDNSESNYNGGISISSGGNGQISTNNGAYSVSRLFAGTYTISYSSLPVGYIMIYPRNGPPPSFVITVGPGCTADNTTGASCNGRGDIDDLNFAISNSIPWIQSVGINLRFDNGFNNTVPVSPACGTGPYASATGNGGTPGIIYTGDSSASFGFGQASTRNWVVGGSSYPERYRAAESQLNSSYTFLLSTVQRSGATITDIQTVCNNLNNCSLPNNLPASVLRANGDLTLNSYSFPNNSNVIILVNGTLTIQGSLRVPRGSTAIISTSRDIIVDQSVGFNPSCAAGNNTLEGVFSADRNFILEGVNDCVTGADQMLRVEGSVIVNAALNGGQFINNRDLCGDNLQYPTIVFAERSDFILNAPELIRKKTFHYQELAP